MIEFHFTFLDMGSLFGICADSLQSYTNIEPSPPPPPTSDCCILKIICFLTIEDSFFPEWNLKFPCFSSEALGQDKKHDWATNVEIAELTWWCSLFLWTDKFDHLLYTNVLHKYINFRVKKIIKSELTSVFHISICLLQYWTSNKKQVYKIYSSTDEIQLMLKLLKYTQQSHKKVSHQKIFSSNRDENTCERSHHMRHYEFIDEKIIWKPSFRDDDDDGKSFTMTTEFLNLKSVVTALLLLMLPLGWYLRK